MNEEEALPPQKLLSFPISKSGRASRRASLSNKRVPKVKESSKARASVGIGLQVQKPSALSYLNVCGSVDHRICCCVIEGDFQ